MRKMIRTAFGYAIAAMVSGVFYREFTKFNGFTDKTTLAFTHLHLFVLGMIMFLVIGLYAQQTNVMTQKRFKTFYRLYNIGLPWTVIMLYVRGIPQVLELELSKGMNAAISGMAGIGHVIIGIGIIMLFMCLKETSKE